MKQAIVGLLALLLLGAGPPGFPWQTWEEVASGTTIVAAEQCSEDLVVILAQSSEWSLVVSGGAKSSMPSLIVAGRFESDSSFVLRPGKTAQDPLILVLGPVKDSSFVDRSMCQTMQNAERLLGTPA